MKKLILTTVLMAAVSMPAFATCDYQSRCASYSPDMLTKTSQFLSKATGTTFISEKIAQSIVEKELKNATGQTFKSEVKAFSVGGLIQGKFKSLSITGENITVEGISFSHLNIKTLCEYNHIDAKSHPLKFEENVVLEFNMEFSGEDLKTTAQNPNYTQIINKANLSELGIASYTINPDSIGIENNKLNFMIKAQPTGQNKQVDIAASMDLNIQNEKIVSSKVNLINLYSDFDLTDLANLPKVIKRLNFELNLFGNPNTQVQIENVSISDNKLKVQGMAFIPKTTSQAKNIQPALQTNPQTNVPTAQTLPQNNVMPPNPVPQTTPSYTIR